MLKKGDRAKILVGMIEYELEIVNTQLEDDALTGLRVVAKRVLTFFEGEHSNDYIKVCHLAADLEAALAECDRVVPDERHYAVKVIGVRDISLEREQAGCL